MLLVDQPWQANLGLRIGNEIVKKNSGFKVTLVFTDYFTFFLRKDYLSGIRNAFIGDVITQEDLFATWQDDSNELKFDYKFLSDWESANCSSRSLDELARTNQWLYGNERDRYQRRISGAWREKILYDTILWCENLFNKIEPDLIISIERCTLPTNLLFEIALRERTNFLTFVPARIGNRWIIREDFAYGMSEELRQNILSHFSTKASLQTAKAFAEDILSNRDGSYISPSHKIVGESFEKRKALLHNLRLELRKWLGRVYGRIFIQPKERSFAASRLLENFISLSYVELRKISINYAHHFGIRLWGDSKVPSKPYFLWALHMRPEGSVLVLGNAKEEIKELLKAANHLPESYFLAVKENPEMFGLRERGFYRRLKSHKRIILVDPFFSTFSLIQGSQGVIGISGTVLLEAALFNKPSCALGHPEFVGFLAESGWESSQQFFLKVLRGDYQDVYARILPYLAYILANSDEIGIPFEGDLETSEAQTMIENFARRILNYAAH